VDLPVDTATSWRLARGGGAPLPEGAREELLRDYLEHLAHGLAYPAAARTAYRQWCDTLGRDVAVHLPDGSVRTGRAVGVTDEGLLEVEGGGTRTVHHVGDVVHVRAAG
jgi:BirA family biotin operon repressor/biotin-[acetyl-CoA-carboxylase] ligase